MGEGSTTYHYRDGINDIVAMVMWFIESIQVQVRVQVGLLLYTCRDAAASPSHAPPGGKYRTQVEDDYTTQSPVPMPGNYSTHFCVNQYRNAIHMCIIKTYTM